MLFLTEGFPHDAGEEPSRRVVRAAERVNAAVYFVDVRGVVASPPWASADAPNDAELNPSRMTPEQVLQIKDMMARAARDRLMTERYVGVETMAEETGGLILRGTNDLGPGLARISAESRSYYLLGYHPTSPARDGQFRKIEVKVTRPGLSVRARKGYEAAGPARAEAPRAAGRAVADVPLRLATYTLEPVAGGKTRVLAAVEVDFAALTAEERNGRRVAHLELRVETSASGRRGGLDPEPVPGGRAAPGGGRPRGPVGDGARRVRAAGRPAPGAGVRARDRDRQGGSRDPAGPGARSDRPAAVDADRLGQRRPLRARRRAAPSPWRWRTGASWEARGDRSSVPSR